MPLVVITGFPSSGKSRRCAELVEYLASHTVAAAPVNVIAEHDFVADRNATYTSVAGEKQARAAMKSRLAASVAADTWTVFDALNYIKGYRYELYCVARQHSCAQLTLHCAVDAQLAWQWNCQRRSPPTAGYQRDVFDALVARYERPSAEHRWDKPLVQLMPEQPTPCELIVEQLSTGGSRPRPHQSTQPVPMTSSDDVSWTDAECRRLIDEVMKAQATAADGDLLQLPGCAERLQLSSRLTLAQLSRHRRQFVSYMRSRPLQTAQCQTGKTGVDGSQVRDMFVQYLNSMDGGC